MILIGFRAFPSLLCFQIMKNTKTEKSSSDLLRLIVCSIQKMTEDAEFKVAVDLEPFLKEV